MKKLKKISMLLVVTMCFGLLNIFPTFAGDPTISSVGISVVGDEVRLTGTTVGDTDGLSINIKVIGADSKMEYFDQLMIVGNAFNLSFVPMNAKKDDKIILKISGDMIYTKEFVYSENGNLPPVTNPMTKAMLDVLTEDYSEYTDYNGNFLLDYTIQSVSGYYVITAKCKDTAVSDSLWLNRDVARFRSFMSTIADDMQYISRTAIKINVLDKNSYLVETYDSKSGQGTAIQKTPSEIVALLNQTFSSYSGKNKTFGFTYSTTSEATAKSLKIKMKGNNFTKLEEAWVTDDSVRFANFLKGVDNYIKYFFNGDISFYTYDLTDKFCNSYDYFYDGDYSQNPSTNPTYVKLEDTSAGQKGYILNLIDYGDNTAKINKISTARSLKDNVYTVKLGDYLGVQTSVVLPNKLSGETTLVLADYIDILNAKKTTNPIDILTPVKLTGINGYLTPAEIAYNLKNKTLAELAVKLGVKTSTELADKIKAKIGIQTLISLLDTNVRKQLVLEIAGNYPTIKTEIPGDIVNQLYATNTLLEISSEDTQIYFDPIRIDVASLKATYGSNYSVNLTVNKITGDEKAVIGVPHGTIDNAYKIEMNYVDTKYNASKVPMDLSEKSSKGITLAIRYTNNDPSQTYNLNAITATKLNDYMGSWDALNSIIMTDIQGMLFSYTGKGTYLLKANEISFSDIDKEDARDAITVLASKNIIRYGEDSSFKANASITKADFVYMITKKLELNVQTSSNNFKDIKESDWYYETLNTAYNARILPDTFMDGKANAEKKLTREEMAYIIYKAYEYNSSNKRVLPSAVFYSDLKEISAWAKPSISILSELNLDRGDGNRFYPKQYATRGEACQIIYDLMKLEGTVK